MDTFQHVIPIIEKEMAKNLTFLQKEIDTGKTVIVRTSVIRRKTSRSIAFSKTVLMMMKHTTEQITDVSCGNTAALVGIEQFLWSLAL